MVTPLQLRCAAPCGMLFPWRTQKPSSGHSMTDNKQLPYSNNWQGTRELDLKTTAQFELLSWALRAIVLLLSSLEEEKRRRRWCHVSWCGHVKMLCREERWRSRSRMLQCLSSQASWPNAPHTWGGVDPWKLSARREEERMVRNMFLHTWGAFLQTWRAWISLGMH